MSRNPPTVCPNATDLYVWHEWAYIYITCVWTQTAGATLYHRWYVHTFNMGLLSIAVVFNVFSNMHMHDLLLYLLLMLQMLVLLLFAWFSFVCSVTQWKVPVKFLTCAREEIQLQSGYVEFVLKFVFFVLFLPLPICIKDDEYWREKGFRSTFVLVRNVNLSYWAKLMMLKWK